MNSKALLKLGQVVALFLGVLALSGCGTREPFRQRLAGVVRLDSKPLAEAQVVLHAQKIANAGVPKPLGVTDEQGRFTLEICSTDSVPAAGNYKITVEQRALRKVGEELIRDGVNQLPAIYAKLDSTPLTFEYNAERSEIPSLELRK